MTTALRPYQHPQDYERVNQFLIHAYQPAAKLDVWPQPRWEYMHHHPFIYDVDLSRIRVAEDNGEIVGMVNFESAEGQVYFNVHRGYSALKPEMFWYAVDNLTSIGTVSRRPYTMLYIKDGDSDLEALADAEGFKLSPDHAEHMAIIPLNSPLPAVKLPDGFALKSLADENDFRKINSVLWRGFNHEGPPPDEEIEGRQFAQTAPNFRHDLTIVAVEPGGNFVSFCGMWYVPQTRSAYVEPVATDPDFRRMGLGKAAVIESLKRVQALGAEVAWVGSSLEFYQAMGFTILFTINAWLKYLD